MDVIIYFVDFFIHLDKYLDQIIQMFGVWAYVIMFLVIFCETGLVVTPILPGDSLLFALGALAAKGTLNIDILLVSLCVAAVLGDTVNYTIGKFLGPRVFHYPDNRFLKKEYLLRTHQFYEKHGGKTIIIARFIPIIRTFAPFVAGIGTMKYFRFITYNIVGGISWICVFLLAGYFFGGIPAVKRNFTLVIIAIIIISVLPGVFEYWRQRRMALKSKH